MSTNFENDREFSDITPKPNSRLRITLAQLLLAIAITVVLSAMLLPASRRARPAAYRAQCANNLKQIALALHNYERDYNALPPAHTVDGNGRPLHSWRTLILPYLEQEALYRTIDLAKPWNDPANARALKTSISIFHCPVAGGLQNTTTYLASAGPNGCLFPTRPRRLAEITDRHETTLMVIEVGEENAIPWMAPVDADELLVLNLGPTQGLHHGEGTNACFVDGRVAFIKGDSSAAVRRALVSITGNDDSIAKEW